MPTLNIRCNEQIKRQKLPKLIQEEICYLNSLKSTICTYLSHKVWANMSHFSKLNTIIHKTYNNPSLESLIKFT